jgi:hypothetical protein
VLDAPAITIDREQTRPHCFFRRHASQNACGRRAVPLVQYPLLTSTTDNMRSPAR